MYMKLRGEVAFVTEGKKFIFDDLLSLAILYRLEA